MIEILRIIDFFASILGLSMMVYIFYKGYTYKPKNEEPHPKGWGIYATQVRTMRTEEDIKREIEALEKCDCQLCK